ncbi:MAG: hypothetical protein RMY36_023265 [Nostoc sp. SerVER01]
MYYSGSILENPNTMSELSNCYNIPNAEQVEQFLESREDFKTLLIEAHEKIIQCFDLTSSSTSTPLALEVITDPEIDNWKQLVVFIPTKKTPEEVARQLEHLEETWWLDADNTDGEIAIHVKFG